MCLYKVIVHVWVIVPIGKESREFEVVDESPALDKIQSTSLSKVNEVKYLG